jgi:eukaryotic-like serine/threonine-protein kinase
MSAFDFERWARLEPYLDELLTLPPIERARRLDEMAANDPGTASELRELLATNDEAARVSFLGTSIGLAFLASTAASGDALGPWTLAEPLGEGGMGSVWRARRNDRRFEGEAPSSC